MDIAYTIDMHIDVFFMIRRPPRSKISSSSAASDVYQKQSQETIAWILREPRSSMDGEVLYVGRIAEARATIAVLPC